MSTPKLTSAPRFEELLSLYHYLVPVCFMRNGQNPCEDNDRSLNQVLGSHVSFIRSGRKGIQKFRDSGHSAFQGRDNIYKDSTISNCSLGFANQSSHFSSYFCHLFYDIIIFNFIADKNLLQAITRRGEQFCLLRGISNKAEPSYSSIRRSVPVFGFFYKLPLTVLYLF